ncbi:MAG: hypothetical protein AAFY28_12465 [Actinomycetota bacterium]
MPTDLEQKAQDALDALDAQLAEVSAHVEALRADIEHTFVERPDPNDPTVVQGPEDLPRNELAANCGARQHVELARALLLASQGRQATIRAALAAIDSPDDGDTHVVALRAELIEAGRLDVELREAEERLEAATVEVGALSRVADSMSARRGVLVERHAWAAARSDRSAALRADLPARHGTMPVWEKASGALDPAPGSPYADADARLDDLLPTDLRVRAVERSNEALARERATATHLAELTSVERDLLERLRPRTAPVEHRRRELDAAEAALAAHVAGAADRIDWALAELAAATLHPDLSTNQAESLDPADRAGSDEAIASEAALTGALAALEVARRAADQERIKALADDPAATTATVPDWGDAENAIADDGTLATAVATARGAHTDAHLGILDDWEVEVPETLWVAVEGFVLATATLQELAVSSYETALVQALDDAEQALADAWDQADAAWTSEWLVARDRAEREALAASTAATSTRRRRQFSRGDGSSGRTRRELGLEPALVGGA